jgi:tRNA A-37 threonylcarbamoyl transferase component Bud32
MLLYLTSEIKRFLAKNITFSQMMQLRGEVYRAVATRCTQRITLGGQNYFIKQHFGVGWREIFKNICQLKRPIVSARNEWLAIQKLSSLHIAVPELVGFGENGFNPATRESFVITRELPPHCTIEDLTKDWRQTPPRYLLKKNLLQNIAHIARTLHRNGINHRDFYICHFLLANISQKLYLIDLHRAQIRAHVPERWVIKDLAGLYFSSFDIGLTHRDRLRFMREYRKKSLREILTTESSFWHKVKQRGDKLYHEHAK